MTTISNISRQTRRAKPRLVEDGFTPVVRGIRPTLSVKVPSLFSGPKTFPPWFAYYTSSDHAVKFEPWAAPPAEQPARDPQPSPLRVEIARRSDTPETAVATDDDDLPALMTVSDSEGSMFSDYPASLTDVEPDDDPIVQPVKGIPLCRRTVGRMPLQIREALGRRQRVEILPSLPGNPTCWIKSCACTMETVWMRQSHTSATRRRA